MARDYNVEGTKSYLYWSIGLALLCLWHFRDGWFPPPRVLADHPLPELPDTLNFIGWPDNYYVYNRLTAIVTAIGSVVCAVIHKFVK